MKSRQGRVVRGSAAAAVAVFVALFSHVAIGGAAMPGPLGIVVPLALAIPIGTVLAGRRLSFTRLSIGVVLSQLLFHGLFVLGAPTATVGASSHHGVTPVETDAVAGAVDASGAAMLGAHAIAALITTVALYFAERGVRLAVHAVQVLRAWLDRLTRPVTHGVAPARLLDRPVEWATRGLTTSYLLTSVLRRGPPLRSAF